MAHCSVGILLAFGLAGTAMSAAAGEALAPLSTFKDCDHCPEMVVIPAGKFLRGSAANEPSRTTWEEPQHEVTFTKPFAIGKYEVTFEEWGACVSAGGCVGPDTGDHGWGRGRRPAILHTWEEATSYADWLTTSTGRRYRLPSEAEWEYAARAGTTTAFATGRTISSDQANFDGTRPYEDAVQGEFRQQTLPVGSYPANAFGLHDMHGNVQEYAEDCWTESYESAHVDGSAWTEGGCKFRAMRGGHWRSGAPMLRSAMRTRVYPNYRRPTIGFRLLAEPSEGQNIQTLTTYDVVNPPPCTNNKGETVRFIESSRGRSGIAAGMAIRDRSGKPVIFRSNYAATPPEFQSFIDRHECAHHQTGDVDRPLPPRNSAEHLMNESISDCVAILRMRDEDGYNRAAFSRVAAAMRHDMAKIGFPEISISSRISNIDNCYTKYGSPQDFIIGILKQRGLL